MRWTARAISAPSADTDVCLSIFFESQPSWKYLFNCGESTFKSVQQRRYGLTKFKGLFLSRMSTETSGGLPGFLMSLADSGSKDMTITGPVGLNHVLATYRSYALRDVLKLNRVEVGPSSESSAKPELVFQDDNLSLYGVPISPPESSESSMPPRSSIPTSPSRRSPSPSASTLATEQIAGQMYRGRSSDPDVPLPPFDWRLHRQPLSPISRASTSVAYIGLGPAVRGKFDAKRATELGVVGPDRAKLTKGESVLSKDGVTTVTPEMCIAPSTPPSAFMIVDCPDPAYIDAIVKSEALDFRRHFPEARLGFVLHSVGRDVLEDTRYVEWMNTFPESTEHLISQREYCADPVPFSSSANMLLRLSELDPEVFVYPQPKPALKSLTDIPNLPSNSHPLELDHTVGMNPPVPLYIAETRQLLDTFTPALQAKQKNPPSLPISPELAEVFQKARKQVAEEEKTRTKEVGDDIVITTLGTGSALPSKYRNVLSTLVQIPGSGNILLDAGEGTWGQLSRRFGAQPVEVNGVVQESPADAILRDVRCIFISHLHADHHIGLEKILTKRRQLYPPPEKPLYLVAGQDTISYLHEYDQLEDLGLKNIRFIENSDITNFPSEDEDKGFVKRAAVDVTPRRQKSREALEELVKEMGLVSLETVGVIHRGPCYGIVVRHQDGWSFAFSGDTMPSENLVEAGKNVTVLIHEASLSNEDEEMAKMKQHSTVGQAIDVGTRMGAKNILLTHFSQRYPKMPSLQPSSTAPGSPTRRSPSPRSRSSPPIAVAFDLVSLPIGSLWKMDRYRPALERFMVELADTGGEDDEEDALRANAMGVPVKALEASDLGKKKGSASQESGSKAQSKERVEKAAGTPAKKRKISQSKSRAVG